MRPSQFSTERKVAVGFGVALTMLLVIGGVSYHSTMILIEESAWVAHTEQVLDQLDEVLSDVKDAETGQRGYIITDDQSYLEPYQSAVTEIYQDLAAVRHLTADNVSQQRRLDALEPLVAARLAQLKKGIDAETAGGHEAGTAVVRQGLGARQMNDIRKAIGEMEDEERRLLGLREAQAKACARRTILTIGFGSLLAFALVGLASFIIHRDISERRRANEALARERHLLHILMDNVPDFIYFKDTASRFTRINRAQASALKVREPEEALGKTDFDFFTPEHARDAYADEQEILRSGQPLIGKVEEASRLDGVSIWVSTTKMPLRDSDGRVIGTFGLSRDITESKRAEEALRRSHEELEMRVQERTAALAKTNEALLAEVAERKQTEDALRRSETSLANAQRIAHLGNWEWNIKTDALRWSEETYRIFGVDPKKFEVSTESFFAFVHPDDAEAIRAAVQKALGEKQAYNIDHRIVRADGEQRFVQERAEIVFDAAGTPERMLGTVLDITERKRAEQELAHERNLFDALMDSIPDTIYFQDTACRFMRINKAQAEMLGVADPKEAIGKTDFDYFPAEIAQGFYDSEQKLLQSGQPIIDAIQKIPKPDGQVQWLSATEVPIYDDQGKIMGYVGISRDITDRKLAEAELQKAKEGAEAASRAKSEFLANMSHEIRTPINGIMGMTELALETELTPEQRQYLDMVKSSADSLLTVINDILDFSRIEAKKLDLDAIEFNLRDNLDDTLKTLALRAHQKGLELACQVQPDVPRAIVGDPGRLRQIIVNLVGNAIKFTQTGEVVVQVGTKSREQDAIWLDFAVRDTGIGIAVEKQRLIFDAFTQADGSMTRRHGGTGLGLSISSLLVEMMQGRIGVESEVGKGSTFHFTARFGLTKAAWTPPPTAEPAHLEGLSVLVVDDNATNRRILEETLTSWRMKPILADSAQAALVLLEQAWQHGNPFRLVLTDAHMPEMDGFTLAERIKQQPHLAGATIMMLTSGGHRGEAARCRELGIAAYLTKPVGQSELLEAILRVLATEPRKTEPAPPITRHSLREGRKGLRILLAEDNAVNQQLAKRMLEKRGHAVVVANTGREALAALERERFDLVLMDVQMPEMDGFEATAAIRQKEKVTRGHMPIIAMTAHAMVGDRERCLAAGMDGYIPKPVSAKDLFEAIKGLVPAAPGVELEGVTTSG